MKTEDEMCNVAKCYGVQECDATVGAMKYCSWYQKNKSCFFKLPKIIYSSLPLITIITNEDCYL
jgi:hypothetical protein